MATVTLPHTSKTATDPNLFSEVKANDQAIINQVNGSLDATNLAANAVTTTRITDLNVTAAKLAADAVTTVKILDANVTTAKIADLNVTSGKLAAGAALANLGAASVTDAKLASPNNSAYKVLARGQMRRNADGSAGLRYPNPQGDAVSSITVIGAPATVVAQHFLDPADHAVAGLTTKIRVTAAMVAGTTAPALGTIGVDLRKVVTLSGGAVTVSTSVASAAPTTPGSNAITTAVSADATFNTAAAYFIEFSIGTIPSADSTLLYAVETRNV